MKALILWCAILVPGLVSGAELTAKEILQRTADVYKNLKGYEFRVDVQSIHGDDVTEQHYREAGSAPEAEFAQIDQHVRDANIARHETLIIDGKPVAVWVVRVTRDQWPAGSLDGAQFAMYRIDKKSFAVRKLTMYSATEGRIVFYNILKWDQPMPEAHATQPAASTESGAILGREAPDFTLTDTNGKAVHLRDLRGNVVMVDFWATWCGPCRALMPDIQKLHNEYAGKGLVVLGLDVGEELPKVTKFAQEFSYTFKLLLGAEPEVAAKYFVTGYPTTYVIDRRGVIVYREVGGGGTAGLRAAVEKALGETP